MKEYEPPRQFAGTGVQPSSRLSAFGGKALELERDLEDACEGDVCPPFKKADVDKYNDKRLLSDVFLGVGAGLAAVGAAMIIISLVRETDEDPESRKPATDVSFSAIPLVDGGMFGLEGRF